MKTKLKRFQGERDSSQVNLPNPIVKSNQKQKVVTPKTGPVPNPNSGVTGVKKSSMLTPPQSKKGGAVSKMKPMMKKGSAMKSKPSKKK